MHPFSLNEEEVKQVAGGLINQPIVSDTTRLFEEGGIVTSMYVGEEGGTPPYETTMALGEEGGLPDPAV